MKKFFEKHALTIWIIASIASIIVVHFLFYAPAPLEWMEARWSAGEILTYIGTVALSLLAVWQNKRFKEENDKSQARLEQLVKHANELSVINKIIEIENERLNNVKEAIEDFDKACNPRLIANEYIKKSPIKIFSVTVRGEVESRINQSLLRIIRLLRTDYTLDKNDSPLIKAIYAYYKSSKEIVNAFDGSSSNPIEDERITSCKKNRDNYFEQSELYIKSLELKLEQVIYGDMSLHEIKMLYHDRITE